jgi:glycerophosphoryl diester phosphodiesterase
VTAIPTLIAHRGWPSRYPENSREGIEAALRAGACMVEFDVQLTKDGVPVVIHDDSLRRTAGTGLGVTESPLEEIRQHHIHEPVRFGSTFAGVRVPTLAEVVELLSAWPRATAFVEIKRASLRRFGTPAVLAAVSAALAPVLAQCVVISFDPDLVERLRAGGKVRTGWATKTWNAAQRAIAVRLDPDYLFCKISALPRRGSLPVHRWTWAAYETSSPQAALTLADRGVTLVETDAIGEMLEHPLLGQKGCRDVP